jgi:hypothetical protein
MTKTKHELINIFRVIIEAIRKNDSFEGQLSYEEIDKELFEVKGQFRIGNQDDKGVVVIIQ